MRFKFVLILFLSAVFVGFAQTKNEKEWRISISAFPESSKTLLKTIENNVNRIRFYKEKDGEQESYECKFKFKKHWFSVEFDNDGVLEDIEVTIRKSQIPEDTKERIYEYLESKFDKHDLIKIQEQYIPSNTNNNANFLNQILNERMQIASNYEIVVAVKSDKIWSIFEITFDSSGAFISQRPVEQDSYEYIMY